MNNLQDLFDDVSDQDMARVKGRIIERGTQIRRRNLVIRTSLVALAVCAIAVPLSLASTQHQAPGTTSSAIQTTSAGPFQDVVWKQYFNPKLNVTKVYFPGNIGCNPGSEYGFRVEVQQVSYIRTNGASSPIALALVRCDNGTPAPSSLYAFTFPRGATQPHVLQALLAPPTSGAATIWYASHFTVSKDAVVLPLRGVSGTDRAGLCCPNVAETMRWTLRGSHFVQQREHVVKLGHTKSSG
jgi:hypothetical protein